MKVDSKKFFIALVVFFAVIIGMGVREYIDAKSAHLNTIKENLAKAVNSTSIIIGSRYYDQLMTAQATPVESAIMIENITKLAQTHDIKELYTVYIDANNTLRYGVSNVYASSGDTIIQPIDPVTKQKVDLRKILNTGQPYFHLDTTQGNHTYYLPGISTSGVHYLNIAITKPISLRKISQTAIFDTISKSLLLFLGFLPLLILYRNILTETAERLSEEVDFTSDKLYETATILHDRVEEKTKELIDEGFIDPITHLPNRHRLLFDMDRNHYAALVIIHLENLHDLNHFFGLSVCDSLRQQFALLLTKMDLNAYRLGRDEFAFLMDSKESGMEIDFFVLDLIKAFHEHPFNVLNEKIVLTVRLGVDTSDNLSLGNANEALLDAVQTSQNYSIFEENIELENDQKYHIAYAASIREAYYDGRIICYYQPIISTKTGAVLIYETLVRLIDKDSTITAPLNFLTIAKKTALYPEISREIIRQACEAFENRKEDFSVHLCALDITNSYTIRYIEETVVTTDTAHRIIFEISEADIYQDIIALTDFITTMKRLGVKISIDNFGADFSNLEKIIPLDIDFLKINGAIINKITHQKRYLETTRAISVMAQALEAKTIAENVEDKDTLALLQIINIDYAQGFYIGKPSHLP